MADNPIRSFSSLQPVNYGSASATPTSNPYQSIAQALDNVSNHMQDRLDIAAQVEGRKAGAIAGINGIPEMQDDTTIRGRAFNMSAMDTAETKLQLDGITNLTELEKAHQADPQGFKQKADAFYSGQEQSFREKGFDPAVSQKILANYKIRQMGIQSQIQNRADAIARDRQLEGALTLQLSLQSDLENASTELYSPNTSPEQKQILLQKMISSGEQLTKSAYQIGADGRLLFDATQRVKLKNAAESAVAQSVGRSFWAAHQDNWIEAYDLWNKGQAGIELPDSNGGVRFVPLRELLGASGYRMAQAEFFEGLKSSLAMQSQVDAAADRAFQKNSDDIFTDLSIKAQDGMLTLQDVETGKPGLNSDHYLALRVLAKGGGASVSDGRELSDIAVRDANGEDVRSLLKKSYEAGNLTTADFLKYYGQNTGRLNQGLKAPVDAARDSLSQRLGVLSKEMGLAQSSAIGQANITYETEITDFVEKNKRQPTIREANAIAEEVYTRFSAMDVESSIISLPLPKSMTQAEKLDRNLSSEKIQQKINFVTAQKLKAVNGDSSLLMDDPDYVSEITNLKKYHDLLKLKETGNGRASQSTN